MAYRISLHGALTGAAVLALAVGACGDNSLVVANENAPDVRRVFASPAGVEAVVSKAFQQMHQGQYGTSDNLWSQSTTMAFESSSNLGNFGMGTRGQIPRNPIDNSRGNSVEIGNFRDFDHLSRNARITANAITALNTFKDEGTSFPSAARHARAKSFAFFAMGFAHGNLALFYDSAALITTDLVGEDVAPMAGYTEVVELALAYLDSALAIAASPEATQGADGWPIPASWMGSTGAAVSNARWQQIVRSYKARFRAGVARTPAERDDVDWTEVIDDATAGIQSDLVVDLDPNGTGWSNAFMVQAAVSAGWHQMTPFIIGMADTAGAYDAWLATALMQRAPFLIRTPDMRFPSGDTRALQQAKTAAPSPGLPIYTAFPYFRNRPTGQDTPSEPWGTSYYDNFRFFAIRATPGNQAPFAIMTRAEIDMLAAEGYLRSGDISAATALIDRYRVPAGLPAVTGLTSIDDPVPGGNACVPHVPEPPNFTTTACGDLFEAMKWEKRIETAFTGYAQWFIDSRGWGDLAEGTALQWPVPYQEMDARGTQFYNSAAIPDNRAARGTYGF
jgi:hypothetical protein